MKAIFLVLIVALASSCASANMAQARHTKGLVDVVLSSLGLDQILTTVQSVGSALYSQLVSLATQLMLSGQQMWQQALPVFNNLVSELTSHAGNAVQLVSQAVLQLTGVLASGPARSSRGIVDTVVELFGLNQIFSQIQNVGTALYSQFVSLATQLLFAGQQMWQQAIPVFNNLVSELHSHAGNAVQLVSQAVLQLTGVLASGPARSVAVQRLDIIGWIAEAFNLSGVWSSITSVGSALYSQFLSLATQLLFSGQQMWQQAQPVFNNLISELHSHAGNAVQLVSQAVLQLTGVLASGPARSVARFDFVQTVVGLFGLDKIWAQIQSVGSALYSQFLSLATQLLFSGQQMWSQAQPVFNNLVAELTSHAGNAVQLVSQAVLQLTGVLASGPARTARFDLIQTVVGLFGLDKIWAQLQSVGTALYSQFVSLATQLLFSGQQMWTQAQPVFNNLVAELTSHAGNAVQLVSQAVLQLTGVLASGPARSARFDLIQTVVGLFGLDKIWAQIQSVGTALYSQFLSLATQLLFSGQQMWTQAQPVFHNLVAELTSHAGNAVQLVSQAVLQLTGVLASGPAY